MSLEETLKTLALETAYALEGIDDPTLPIAEMGEMALEIEDNFRGIAIGVLLTKGNSDAFLHNLVRGSRIWKQFLDRCKTQGAIEDHNYCSGLFAPLLDAIAARDWELAMRLGELGPSEYREGHEHEDDYAYARALYGILTSATSKEQILALFARCEATGDSMGKARANVGNALVTRDQESFAAAFADLLQARTTEIVEAKARGQIESPPTVAQRQVFIEGVALLNLADRLGFTTDSDYPLCPSLARVPQTKPVNDD
jgi:hypothetical protein